MQNTIVWGDLDDEILLNGEGGANFTVLLAYSLLKTTLADLDINQNKVNRDPVFVEPEAYNYRLQESSPAINKGVNLMIDTDLDGNTRGKQPDIGAYEWQN